MKLNDGRSGMGLRPSWDRRPLRIAGAPDNDVILLP